MLAVFHKERKGLMKPVQTGIERLIADPPRSLRGKRLGLLANPASVDRNFCHSRILIDAHFGGQLKALFSPQHGFYAQKQDNMIGSEDTDDPELNIPVFSLYGDTRIPSKTMLDLIDTLIIDLQDVGTRVYTFIYTMALCMQACRSHDKEVIVLDRPNPLGGTIMEGNCVKQPYRSFVGMYPIPMRHGLSIGELALLFNAHFAIGCRLTVIPMVGWTRHMFYQDTGLPWIPPSPNLPGPNASMVYPGQVLWEGTNVSEGRGTTQPFEIFGAPFFDTTGLGKELAHQALSGMHLRPIAFEPTSNKWNGQLCHGFQIHVIDRSLFRPYFTTIAIMKAVFERYHDDFHWKLPPYEYEFEKLPFDMISGDPAIRSVVQGEETLEDMVHGWDEDVTKFDRIRRDYLLYE